MEPTGATNAAATTPSTNDDATTNDAPGIPIPPTVCMESRFLTSPKLKCSMGRILGDGRNKFFLSWTCMGSHSHSQTLSLLNHPPNNLSFGLMPTRFVDIQTNELFDVYYSYKEAKDVWESMVTKYIVEDACKQKFVIGKLLQMGDGGGQRHQGANQRVP